MNRFPSVVELYAEAIKTSPRYSTVNNNLISYELTEYGKKLLKEMGKDLFTDFLNNLIEMDDQYNLSKILVLK